MARRDLTECVRHVVNAAPVVDLARVVLAEFREKNVTFLAGSIAYSAFVSLVPLLLLFVLALAVFGAGWADRFLPAVTGTVSPTVARAIERIAGGRAGGSAGTSLAGLVVLVWGALKLFRGLDTAFAIIYGVEGDTSFAGQVKDGLVVFASLALAAAAFVATTTAFEVFAAAVPLLGVFLPVLLAAGLVVAFFPMYYVFPGVDVSAREVLPGIAVAATGWAFLQGLFQVYVSLATGGATSLIAGVMFLVTWLYFSAVVMLIGAVVNAVLGGYTERSVALGG